MSNMNIAGFTEKFNSSHYFNVVKSRIEQGLSVTPEEFIDDHPLVGRQLKNLETGEISLIRDVRKCWWRGHYLLIGFDGSDKFDDLIYNIIAFLNINSHDPEALDVIATNQEKYEVL